MGKTKNPMVDFAAAQDILGANLYEFILAFVEMGPSFWDMHTGTTAICPEEYMPTIDSKGIRKLAAYFSKNR